MLRSMLVEDAAIEPISAVWQTPPGNVWGGVTTSGTVPGAQAYLASSLK